MKFILILACLVCLYVAHTQAQRSTCPGIPNRTNCAGGKNVGAYQGPHCRANYNANMYYYSSLTQTCYRMTYQGCAGNSNRYCTELDCKTKCRRRSSGSSSGSG